MSLFLAYNAKEDNLCKFCKPENIKLSHWCYCEIVANKTNIKEYFLGCCYNFNKEMCKIAKEGYNVD